MIPVTNPDDGMMDEMVKEAFTTAQFVKQYEKQKETRANKVMRKKHEDETMSTRRFQQQAS
jgi:hypothetical protein